jgi:hypothetical protein
VSRAKLRNRVARAEARAALAAPPVGPPVTRPEDEARELAREAATAFAEAVRTYREHFRLPAEEAVRRAAESDVAALERILNGPPGRVSWYDLDKLARADPEAAMRRWGEVKAAARGELRSGHRAVRTLEVGFGTCWGRAQFLAVRSELVESLRPRDAAELLLIDQMAAAQVQLWDWQQTLAAYAEVAVPGAKGDPRRGSAPGPPRVTDAAALEQAAAMVERFQRLFHRALAALQGLRRKAPVVVRHAGQVNVGQQQINVSG